MRFSAKILKNLNKCFKLPVHPFNLKNDEKLTYGEWQYQKGIDTVQFFLPFASLSEMFSGKTVVDIGCGAGGKTLFYAKQGAKKIYGVEVLEKYRNEADALAEKLGLSDVFEFVAADAAKLPFDDNVIDTIIMNDAFEHVDEPEKVLAECFRVLKPLGRIYMNFPPYHHPFGAHLSDAIGMPWVHLFFSDRTLIEVYRDAVANLPDGAERIEFRIATDQKGREYFSYINKMTLKRAKRILRKSGYTPIYYSEAPLRNMFRLFTKLPLVREMFVKMVTCVFEKD